MDLREFITISKEELKKYPNIRYKSGKVVEARCMDDCKQFRVRTEAGDVTVCKVLLLATGMKDMLPEWEDFDKFWGGSIHICPFCDGYEHNDEPIGVFGKGEKGSGLTLEMTIWSKDLILFTDGDPKSNIPAQHLKALQDRNIPVVEEKIVKIEGDEKTRKMERVVLADGQRIPRSCLFFNTGRLRTTEIVDHVCSKFTEKGDVEVAKHGVSKERENLYIAGNLSSRSLQFAVTSASEGAKAAFSINEYLLEQELGISL